MEKPVTTTQIQNKLNAIAISKISLIIKNIDNELTQELLAPYYSEQKKLKEQQQLHSNNSNYSDNSNSSQVQQPINPIRPFNEDEVRRRALIYQERVNAACRNHQIYYTDYNQVLSGALQKRGWLEKLAYNQYKNLHNLTNEALLKNARLGNSYEKVYLSRLLKDCPASFVWHFQNNLSIYVGDTAYMNHISRGKNLDFTTKIGLIGCSEQELWYRNEKEGGMTHPRFYRLGNAASEHTHFVEDYHRTQCRSLIRFLWSNSKNCNSLCDEANGEVPSGIVTFALENLKKQVAEIEYFGLNGRGDTPLFHGDAWWRYFINCSNNVIYKKAKLGMNAVSLAAKIRIGRKYLDRLEKKFPDFKWDGCRNLWILKPGYECRGNGIVLKKSLNEILHHANLNSTYNFIVQKYIERPLLIYKTKFDIRIYMLLTIENDILTIWLYGDCYLRFSSQIFNLDVLNQAVHITNNAVQRNYKNYENRDSRLPNNNMWTLAQFTNYLRDKNNFRNVWPNKILPGIKENLIAAVKTGLEEFNFANKTFELFGCDFMLDSKYNPILIEINTNPDLTPSTAVTERLCPMVLRDMVKVVVDLPNNSRATTGLFEAISRINCNVTRNRPTEETPEVISTQTLKTMKSILSAPHKRNDKSQTEKRVTLQFKSPSSTNKQSKTGLRLCKDKGSTGSDLCKESRSVTNKRPGASVKKAIPGNPKPKKETKKQIVTSKLKTSTASKK